MEVDLCFVVSQLWTQVVARAGLAPRVVEQVDVDNGSSRNFIFDRGMQECVFDARSRLGQDNFWRMYCAGRCRWLNMALTFLLDDLLMRGVVVRHPEFADARLVRVWMQCGRVVDASSPEVVWHLDRVVRPQHAEHCLDLACRDPTHSDHSVCATGWLPDGDDVPDPRYVAPGGLPGFWADLTAPQFGVFEYLPQGTPFSLFRQQIFAELLEAADPADLRVRTGTTRVVSSLDLAQAALKAIVEKVVVADIRERQFLDVFASEPLPSCDFVVRQGPRLLCAVLRIARSDFDSWARNRHSVTARRRLLAAKAQNSFLVVEGEGQVRCLEALREKWTREGVVVVETRDVQETVNFLRSSTVLKALG